MQTLDSIDAASLRSDVPAFRPGDTDWARITSLYAILAEVMPSPVIELNRAVAVSMAYGPQAGLDLLDKLAAEPSGEGGARFRVLGLAHPDSSA